MMYQILQGDCLETLKSLPECSVQTCVTSPPYYRLRDYGVDGQIGLEQSPEEYIDKLVSVFREVRRVLKDDGTLWLNLGDSYNGSGGAGGDYSPGGLKEGQPKYPGRNEKSLKPKDLMMMPARVALALQADGWWLRSEIVWHKPNPMPESVTDRPTKSHEMIYLLAKSAKYFYDYVAIQEPAAYDGRKDEQFKGSAKYKDSGQTFAEQGHPRWNKNADGLRVRNKRDVWTVVTKSYREAHFATYNPDLIEPCILAGTSAKGECPKCGKAWARVVEKETSYDHVTSADGKSKIGPYANQTGNGEGTHDIRHGVFSTTTTTGWQPQCECGEQPVPQKVLDPFNGSGTTGEVSIKHGRNYIGCELNPAYIELTHKRLAEVQPAMM